MTLCQVPRATVNIWAIFVKPQVVYCMRICTMIGWPSQAKNRRTWSQAPGLYFLDVFKLPRKLPSVALADEKPHHESSTFTGNEFNRNFLESRSFYRLQDMIFILDNARATTACLHETCQRVALWLINSDHPDIRFRKRAFETSKRLGTSSQKHFQLCLQTSSL